MGSTLCKKREHYYITVINALNTVLQWLAWMNVSRKDYGEVLDVK